MSERGDVTAVSEHVPEHTSDATSVAVSVHDLTRDFAGVRAVDQVTFSIARNTIHCLVGENGAGKSTLVKMLTGALQPTAGTMTVRGVPFQPADPGAARAGGIATLFQELHVVDQLTVQENLTLGMERTRLGFLARSDLDGRVVDTLKALDPSIDPAARVGTLSVAQKQIVEIARAASSGASVIIMDEPTAALSEREVERLFRVIRRLRESDVTVVYISHKLDEIFELGDAVTVLRDGRHIATKPLAQVAGRAELIEMMIGRTVFQGYRPRDTADAPIALAAEHLTNHLLRDVSFDIRRGEVVGFYGLMGAGKTEIARAIFGADRLSGGTITLGDRDIRPTPRTAIGAGIALVPEERRTQGLFARLTIRQNIPVMNLRRLASRGVIHAAEERSVATGYVEMLRIATDSIDKSVAKLSGGNQQKVVLAKCLFANAGLLLLDEPTRGVDVGAKAEIYDIIRGLAESGTSIAVFSSELEEVLGICDRIYLLFAGSLVATVRNGPDVDPGWIMDVVTGGGARVTA
jgi:ribose transport system ATP-binding protein